MPYYPPRIASLPCLKAWMLVFMLLWFILLGKKHEIIAINRRTHAIRQAGGRGCACALAFSLYYLHHPHNFFCNIAPRWGVACVWLSCGCMPFPPSPYPHARLVCTCRVLVVWKERCLAFMWLPSRR